VGQKEPVRVRPRFGRAVLCPVHHACVPPERRCSWVLHSGERLFYGRLGR
jgi:hypothetical protein